MDIQAKFVRDCQTFSARNFGKELIAKMSLITFIFLTSWEWYERMNDNKKFYCFGRDVQIVSFFQIPFGWKLEIIN
jgi:hypothetical protein